MLRIYSKANYAIAPAALLTHLWMPNLWATKVLIPWFVAGGLIISFSGNAGYVPPQPELGLKTTNLVDITGSLPQKQQIDLAKDSSSGFSSPAILHSVLEQPLTHNRVSAAHSDLFDTDMADMSSGGFEGIAFSYEGYMPRVLLETPQWDGATQITTYSDIAPGFAISATTSPSILSAITARAPDGATPSISAAITLASTTPEPLQPQIVMMPNMAGEPKLDQDSKAILVQKPETAQKSVKLALAPAQSNAAYSHFIALIDPKQSAREQKCLAEAIYFEARSEPAEGQAAVAQVVLNRVKSGLYPSTVCGVVYQNRHRYMACQFSFACEGKSLRVTEMESWGRAVRIAKAVIEGKTYLEGVGVATHYHANYVNPTWSRRLKKTDKIGTHIFYKLRPGQA